MKLILLHIIVVTKSVFGEDHQTNNDVHKNKHYEANLPDNHLTYLYNQFPNLAPPHYNFTSDCWGFQNNCQKPFSYPSCDGNFAGWANSREQAERMFYSDADFGYIGARRRELNQFCEKPLKGDPTLHSSLRCSKDLQFCEGENIIIDFNGIEDRVSKENLRYKMDLLSPGDVQVNCKFDYLKFSGELNFMSPLQSWAPELKNIRESNEPISGHHCDMIFNRPVILMKLDAYVNMYHHFCDFINVYMSLFVRPVTDGKQMFTPNNQIIIWENYKYVSNFAPLWRAFTQNPLINLNDVAGKRLCFRKLTFPLLPRMMYGLFYNTPLIPGCHNSGLFTAFSQFILHRLRIPVHEPSSPKLRVTLLLRNTKYRNIVNSDELIDILEQKYIVQVARFSHRTDFTHQLEIIRNSDMLIGIHGAGLTHMLFLPPWAAVFEVYNCDDPGCYSDLSRLRGLKYLTWEDDSKVTSLEADSGHPYSGPAHQKFMNYKFDVDEFSRLVEKLAHQIYSDQRYKDTTAKFSTGKEEL